MARSDTVDTFYHCTFCLQLNILHVTIDEKFFFSAVSCGRLDVPVNGSRKGSLTVFPNTMTFTCDEGFNLLGSPSRTCQANRTWSGEKTICQGTRFFHLLVFIFRNLATYIFSLSQRLWPSGDSYEWLFVW